MPDPPRVERTEDATLDDQSGHRGAARILDAPQHARQGMGDLGRYAGLGLQMAVSMVLFAFCGWWLDGRLSTYPWLLIVGVFVGFFASMYSVLRSVPPVRSKADQNTPR